MQKQTTMKRSRLFLWILGIIMQAFLVSIHFYQKNVEAMRTESEDLLVEVLEKELHRKQQELNLFYISKVTVDTVPLIIRVTTSEGVKSYAVDAKKSKKNIIILTILGILFAAVIVVSVVLFTRSKNEEKFNKQETIITMLKTMQLQRLNIIVHLITQ